MLIMRIPTIINDEVRLTEFVPFEQCIKWLKYYFANIREVRVRLMRGEIIETPYYNFKYAESFQNRTSLIGGE